MPEPIRFSRCPKNYTRDQDKAITPEQTLDYFYRQLSKLDFSILSEVKRIDNGRLDIPVYFSVCTEEAQAVTGTRKQMGKGASAIQAQASACMELAERFSLFAFIADQKNFISGDYAQLRRQQLPVLEPHFLLSSVADDRLTAEQLEAILEGVPFRWTWATEIETQSPILVPFSWFYAINEFNGSSAGNTLEEAALQGLSEIVERDVCARIHRDQIETPIIEPDSLTDPVARELIQKFKDQNIELYLNDFSLDTGICTVGALAVDPATFPERSEIVFTAGTTPGPEKAVIRAVTEVAQLGGDFNTGSNYVASGLPKPISMAEVAYVTSSQVRVGIEDLDDLSDPDIEIELKRFVAALKANRRKVFMVDVTHPVLQIPALYTIVPGAQFRERSASNDAGLFAAKLISELIEDRSVLLDKLEMIERLAERPYYVPFYRGIDSYRRGRPEAALPDFERSLQREPEPEDLPYVHLYQAHCLKDMECYQEALAALEAVEKLDSQWADLYNLRGVCYYKQSLYQQAVASFEQAVRLNPASAMDYANLGVNHRCLGNRDQAIEYFTLALTLDDTIEFAREQLQQLIDD